MQPLLPILGAVIIGLASYSAEARSMGHGGGRATGHFAGNRFGFHHFGFNRFGRFGFNRRFFGSDRFNGGGDFGGGYGGYGWGYGGDDYPSYAVPPNIVALIPQPTPGAAPARPRGDLPPCHEVTSFEVVIERGMGCSAPQPTVGAVPSAPSQAEDLPPCHEVTPFGAVVDRGMACSRGSG